MPVTVIYDLDNPVIRNYADSCGQRDTTLPANKYWNNVRNGLKEYHAEYHRNTFILKFIFETEQDYMFFQLKYA